MPGAMSVIFGTSLMPNQRIKSGSAPRAERRAASAIGGSIASRPCAINRLSMREWHRRDADCEPPRRVPANEQIGDQFAARNERKRRRDDRRRRRDDASGMSPAIDPACHSARIASGEMKRR